MAFGAQLDLDRSFLDFGFALYAFTSFHSEFVTGFGFQLMEPETPMEHLNLNGTVLRIGTRLDNSYTYDVLLENVTLPDGSTLPVLQGGYAVNLLYELSQMLNFSYKVIPTVSHLDLDKATAEKIDLFAFSSSLRIEKAQLVDFSYVIEQSRVIAFMNHAFETSGRNILTDPFSFGLWAGVLGLIIFILLAIFCFSVRENASVLDAQFQCIALILQKDTPFQFRRNHSRSVLWISGMSFIIITGSYSGNIISIKSVVKYKINSLQALIDSDYNMLLEYGNENNASTVLQIARTGAESGLGIMSDVLKKCRKSKFKFKNFQQAIRDVDSNPLAYVIDEETGFSAIITEIGHFPCSWDKISFVGIQYPWTFYMRRNAPHKAIINSGLLILDERGIRQRIANKWITRGSVTGILGGCAKDNQDYIPISNSELEFGYIVLVVGFLISALITLLEYYLCNVHRFVY